MSEREAIRRWARAFVLALRNPPAAAETIGEQTEYAILRADAEAIAPEQQRDMFDEAAA